MVLVAIAAGAAGTGIQMKDITRPFNSATAAILSAGSTVVELWGLFVCKMSLTYKEKLQSVFWQKKRLAVLNEARWLCRECQTPDLQLQVHHVFYLPGRDPWDYPDHLLLALCDSCHKRRQAVEVQLFSNVAEILWHKSIEDIQNQPIWTMFNDERPATKGGAI